MTEQHGNQERRRSLLIDSDLERIGEAFDVRLMSFCEKIGYDVTTPDSRAQIREDHTFIRNLRTRFGWVVATMVGAALASGVAAAFGVN